ncbi:S8 family serine peptidase, partial [uncultured Phyllobacterium sp.]|uniref:S8 family serine peptidase n=1 Tax=uncultured Phyllobacterium sp. TaxID=253813 RepID=UPI00258A81A7
MFFHASGAAFSARSDRLSKFRNHLMSSVCAALIVAAAGSGAHAQEVPGKYFNADGSRTDDLEKAAATWRADKEFQGNWGVGALKAEYAYARGLYGQNIKIGVVDSGIYLPHPEFTPSRFHPVTVEGNYLADNNWTDDKKRTFKKGEVFSVPGVYISGVNNAHGTEVSGTIGAAKDGVQFHGVSFEADIYSANTNGTDNIQQGSNNLDYNYFTAVYDALGKQGTRVINNSWGQISSISAESRVSTPNELANAYKNFGQLRTSGHKTWLDAIAESVEKHDVIQTNWAGNADVESPTSPSLEPNLPYFRSELEGHWLAVSGYARDMGQVYNKCGAAKYWCVMAPTDVLSTDINGGYSPNFNGTSAATPHASASLALIMQRFPYMTNAESLSVLLTTAQNMEDDPNRPQHTLGKLWRNVTPLKPGLTDLPNAYGWGLIDLKKAMNGPGQFLGRFDANLGAGVKDTWSNDISQVALDQRKREETEEVAAWAARKKAQGWESGFGEKQRSELAKIIQPQFSSDKIAAAEALLTTLFKAIGANKSSFTKAVMDANRKIKADPLASALLADFTNAYPKAVTTYGTDPSADFAAYKAGRKDDPLAVLKQKMLAEQITSLETEYQFTESRTAYLSGKLADPKSYDAGLTKSGPGSLSLTGKNTYRSDTLINSGELGIGLGGSIVSASVINDTGLLTVDGTAAAVTANAGGQLKVNATGATGDLMLNGG